MSDVEPHHHPRGEVAPRHIPQVVVPVAIGEVQGFVREAVNGTSLRDPVASVLAGWVFFEPYLRFTPTDDTHTRIELDLTQRVPGADTLLFTHRRGEIDRFFVAIQDELDRRAHWRLGLPASHQSTIDAIAARTREADVPGVRILAIDGKSGSGKSTLGAVLARTLDAPLIQIDDFVSWHNFSGWWPRFDKQVLAPLLDGRDAVYQKRDWAGDEFGRRLGDWRTVPWAPIVVIEGVTSTRQAISAELACSVWVDAPADVRLERGLQRDREDHRHLWEQWMVHEAVFFDRDDPQARADFLVSGTA